MNGETEEILLQGTSPLSPSDWARDGRWLVYTDLDAKTSADIWLLPNPVQRISRPKSCAVAGHTVRREPGPDLCRHAEWLAYTSNESGG